MNFAGSVAMRIAMEFVIMMIEIIISGGQTGVDQAGWRAAKECGIPTRGWMPKGWLTEDGPRPEFETLYNAQEHKSSEYPPRTMANVLSADATIWIGDRDTLGFGCTIQACRQGPRPYFIVNIESSPTPREVALWIKAYNFKMINISGTRASKDKYVGELAEKFLIEVFRMVNSNGNS